MNVTITPPVCGRTYPGRRISEHFTHLDWTCSEDRRCSTCTPLGERMISAAHCYHEFSNQWGTLLAWNLCLAALIDAPFQAAITMKPIPPEMEAELMRRIDAMRDRPQRAIVLDMEVKSGQPG